MTLFQRIRRLADRLTANSERHRSEPGRFENGPRIPWSRGYSSYRNRLITQTLQSPERLSYFGQNGHLPTGYGFKIDERTVEIPWVYSKLNGPNKHILDAGCAFFKFPETHKIVSADTEVTLMTLDERDMKFDVGAARLTRLPADLRQIPLPDGSFDKVICISTIEHVGMDNTLLYTDDCGYRENTPEDYRRVAAELARVLSPTGDLLLTVPFGLHRQHGWLQIFDAAMLDKLIAATNCQVVEEIIFKHGAQGWTKSDRQNASGSVYFDVHAEGADAKNSCLAAAEAVACLHLKAK